MEVMIAHTRDPVVPPSQLRPGIPSDLEQVVMRCLAKKPGDRFPDTPSLAEALAPVPTPPAGRRDTPPNGGGPIRTLPTRAGRGRPATGETGPAPAGTGIVVRRIGLGRSEPVEAPGLMPTIDVIPHSNLHPARFDRPDAMQPTPTHHEPNDDRAGHDWMTEPLDATVHLAFAFDIGDEIDLDRARLILQGEPGQLPRRRRTPESIGYRPAPIRVEVAPDGLRLPGDPAIRSGRPAAS